MIARIDEILFSKFNPYLTVHYCTFPSTKITNQNPIQASYLKRISYISINAKMYVFYMVCFKLSSKSKETNFNRLNPPGIFTRSKREVFVIVGDWAFLGAVRALSRCTSAEARAVKYSVEQAWTREYGCSAAKANKLIGLTAGGFARTNGINDSADQQRAWLRQFLRTSSVANPLTLVRLFLRMFVL